MRLSDLAAEGEANARATRLGREERDEQIRGPGNSRTFVVDPVFNARSVFPPADVDAAAGLESCVGGDVQQVDQQLIELIRNPGTSDTCAVRQRTTHTIVISH